MQYTSLSSIAAAFDDPAVSVISFDIFDTLLVRPAGSEDVRFGLLDRRFGELSASHTNFAGIRKLAEEQLRRQIIRGELSKEDVTLDEIYGVIRSDFLIAPDLADAMKEEEFLMERRLCRPRASGAELYRRALLTGKKVILISDMYLTADRIRILLDGAGYRDDAGLFVSSETGTRKISGRLYLDAAAGPDHGAEALVPQQGIRQELPAGQGEPMGGGQEAGAQGPVLQVDRAVRGHRQDQWMLPVHLPGQPAGEGDEPRNGGGDDQYALHSGQYLLMGDKTVYEPARRGRTGEDLH